MRWIHESTLYLISSKFIISFLLLVHWPQYPLHFAFGYSFADVTFLILNVTCICELIRAKKERKNIISDKKKNKCSTYEDVQFCELFVHNFFLSFFAHNSCNGACIFLLIIAFAPFFFFFFCWWISICSYLVHVIWCQLRCM